MTRCLILGGWTAAILVTATASIFAMDFVCHDATHPVTIRSPKTYDNVMVQSGCARTVDAPLTVNANMTVQSRRVATRPPHLVTGLVLHVTETLEMQASGRVNVSGLGPRGDDTGGRSDIRGDEYDASGLNIVPGSSCDTGGRRYGGRSGANSGTPNEPCGVLGGLRHLGWGGGTPDVGYGGGEADGGLVRITAGTMIVDGSMLVNGESAPYVPINRSAGGSDSRFIDLYSGAAFTQDAPVSVKEFAPFFNPPASVRQTVDFDAPGTFGGRIGHWFEGVPQLGLALDVSFFRAGGKGVNIDLFPVSELLMLRWAMRRSTDFPKGRLQPYVGIGPGIFVIPNFEVDFRPAVTKVSGESIEVGLDVRAGLAWQLHKRFAIFAEYRFTYVNVDIEKKGCVTLACALSIFGSEGTSSAAEATLDTHHLLLGMSFPF